MINWKDASKEKPKLHRTSFEDDGETITYEESDTVLIKCEVEDGELPYGFARYEIDQFDDGDRYYWVEEESGLPYDLDAVIAWAPLSELE